MREFLPKKMSEGENDTLKKLGNFITRLVIPKTLFSLFYALTLKDVFSFFFTVCLQKSPTLICLEFQKKKAPFPFVNVSLGGPRKGRLCACCGFADFARRCFTHFFAIISVDFNSSSARIYGRFLLEDDNDDFVV